MNANAGGYFGVVTMETICARCGVVILPKAPRVDSVRTALGSFSLKGPYHPGCWAAKQRRGAA